MVKTSVLIWALFYFLSFPAFAGTLLIVTDEASAAHAERVAQWLKSHEPFSSLPDFGVEIEKTSAAVLGSACHTTDGQRSLLCGADMVQLYGGKGYVKILVIKNDTRILGAAEGLNAPTAATTTAALDKKPLVAVHELLHTAGFQDEYDLNPDVSDAEKQNHEEEASAKCQDFAPTPNVVFIKDRSYASDAEARADLSAKVPWLPQVPASTPVSTNFAGRFLPGTESGQRGLGLFRIKICERQLVYTGRQAYKATGETTVMEDDVRGIIPPFFYPNIREAFSGPGIPGPERHYGRNPKNPGRPPAGAPVRGSAKSIPKK